MEEHISQVSQEDQELFNQFLKEKKEFEDSFHYLQIYFASGGQKLYKYWKDESLIFFSQNRRGHIKVFKPLGKKGERELPLLISHLSTKTSHPIDLRFLTKERVKFLKEKNISLSRLQRIEFLIYSLSEEGVLGLKGKRWKNVRQKCNQFSKRWLPSLTVESLSQENLKDAVHFFGKWKRTAKERGFSYINIEKNKRAVRYLVERIDNKNVWCLLYRLRGKVEGVQALYRINEHTAAHVIGMVNIGFKGFSEWSQIYVWRKMFEAGVKYINDGYSWTAPLREYKMKFHPVKVKIVYRGIY